MTISQHAQLIKERYSYRNFQDSDCQKFLYDWLYLVLHTTETTEMLSDMLLKKCLEEKYYFQVYPYFNVLFPKLLNKQKIN